jgi:hypothetical protein
MDVAGLSVEEDDFYTTLHVDGRDAVIQANTSAISCLHLIRER